MATNYVRDGATLTYSNSGSEIAAGAAVIAGNTIGVALTDIAATTGIGELAVEGVFTLPKVSGAVIAAGEMVMWDASAGAFDDSAATPASGDITYGATAMEAAGNGVTSLKVKLHAGGVKA